MADWRYYSVPQYPHYFHQWFHCHRHLFWNQAIKKCITHSFFEGKQLFDLTLYLSTSAACFNFKCWNMFEVLFENFNFFLQKLQTTRLLFSLMKYFHALLLMGAILSNIRILVMKEITKKQCCHAQRLFCQLID